MGAAPAPGQRRLSDRQGRGGERRPGWLWWRRRRPAAAQGLRAAGRGGAGGGSMRAAGLYCLRRGAEHPGGWRRPAARPCPARRSPAERGEPPPPPPAAPWAAADRRPAAGRAPGRERRRAERPGRRPFPPPFPSPFPSIPFPLPPLPLPPPPPEPSAAPAGGNGGGGLGAPSPLRARRGEDAWGGDGFSPVASPPPPLPRFLPPPLASRGRRGPVPRRGAVARLPPAPEAPIWGASRARRPVRGVPSRGCRRMTAPCRRREEGGGRPPSAITGRAAAAAPWGCAAAPSARWPGWVWTPPPPAPSPSGCTRRRPGRRGRPSGPRAAAVAAAAVRAPTPRTPMATVTRRREAVTIETGCCTWAPGPRWPMRCPSTSHRGGSARTAVSTGLPGAFPPSFLHGFPSLGGYPGAVVGTVHTVKGGAAPPAVVQAPLCQARRKNPHPIPGADGWVGD